MHRERIAAALIAALPALAFGQSPSMGEKPHPSNSAHANATAGAAGAQRIEACIHAADGMIAALDKGDFKAAASDFDTTMQHKLGAEKLGEVWKQVEGKLGKLQKIGAPQNMMYQNYVVVIQLLHFATGELDAQVACDIQGKIAGFFVRPGASAAPASGD